MNESTNEQLKHASVSKGIGRYLTSLEGTTTVGKQGVSLGAIGHGLPAWTNNPDHVEQAIKLMKERTDGSAMQRLKRTQRVHELQRTLDALTREGNDAPRAYFIEHALAWATEERIGYAAFRELGVPVDVLKAAGIKRTFEP